MHPIIRILPDGRILAIVNYFNQNKKVEVHQYTREGLWETTAIVRHETADKILLEEFAVTML